MTQSEREVLFPLLGQFPGHLRWRPMGPGTGLERTWCLCGEARGGCLDQAEFHKAGGDGTLGAAVGGGDLRDRFVGREGIAELLLLLGRPTGADLRVVGVNGTLRGTLGVQGLPARAAGRIVEGVHCHEQGPDGVGLLVRAVRRELFAGSRVAAIGQGSQDCLGAIDFHIRMLL